MPVSENQVRKALKKIVDGLPTITAKIQPEKKKSPRSPSPFNQFKKRAGFEHLVNYLVMEINGSKYRYSDTYQVVSKHQMVGTLMTIFPDSLPFIGAVADYLTSAQNRETSLGKPKKAPRKLLPEGDRLAELSVLIRESSLKRFNQVTPDDRSWRPSPNQLSFVDILKHLVDSDRWILATLNSKAYIPKAQIKPGDGRAEEWDTLLSDLRNLGRQKSEWLKEISIKIWAKDVSKWFALMRSNFDHEIHHRGALQVMLRLKYNP